MGAGGRVLLVGLLLTGSASCGGSGTREEPAATGAPASAPAPGQAPVTPGDAATQRWVAGARADLAQRYGVPLSEVRLVSVEQVLWPNAGLGCPATGRAYDPAPVPGYRIRLARGALTYAFHGRTGERPALCRFLD